MSLASVSGTGSSNPSSSSGESANPRSLSTSAIGVEGRGGLFGQRKGFDISSKRNFCLTKETGEHSLI
jgi:hypothetical protein